MAYLELRNIKKSFGDAHIIKGVDLEIQKGEFIVFVGPSGCGKSTLIRILAGLEEKSSGAVLLQGEPVTGPGTGGHRSERYLEPAETTSERDPDPAIPKDEDLLVRQRRPETGR